MAHTRVCALGLAHPAHPGLPALCLPQEQRQPNYSQDRLLQFDYRLGSDGSPVLLGEEEEYRLCPVETEIQTRREKMENPLWRKWTVAAASGSLVCIFE